MILQFTAGGGVEDADTQTRPYHNHTHTHTHTHSHTHAKQQNTILTTGGISGRSLMAIRIPMLRPSDIDFSAVSGVNLDNSVLMDPV